MNDEHEIYRLLKKFPSRTVIEKALIEFHWKAEIIVAVAAVAAAVQNG